MSELIEAFPYQKEGAVFLAGKTQALLGDEMGLGKSCQAILAADIIGASNILVFCPANVRVNWSREWTRFSPFDRPCTVILTGKDKLPPSGVVICSYDLMVPIDSSKAVGEREDAEFCVPLCLADLDLKESKFLGNHWETVSKMLKRNLRWELTTPNVGVAHFLLTRDMPGLLEKTKSRAVTALRLEKERKAFLKQFKRPWDLLILDEAHYLKERSADRTKAIYGHNSTSPGLAAHTKRIWRLTGTPAPNNFSELWTHLKSAGVITDAYWDFTFRFCTGIDTDYDFKITGSKNIPELKALLKPFMLRRKKDSVMKELPPIQYQEVTVERSKVELDITFFEAMRGKSLPEFLGEIKNADTALRNALAAIKPEGTPLQDRVALLSSMAKSLVTLRRYIGMAKLPNVCDILAEELASNQIDKVVIFAVHRDVIEGARVKLAKFGAVTLYGGTDPKKKQYNVDKFMTDPKCRVFIGNVQAAGTGITLTSACEVAFLEADWVPANNAQAAMRCHRIGQSRPVRVRFFSCEGSVDEQVQTTLLRKSRELTKIF